MPGWMGRVLRVDLGSGRTAYEPLDPRLARDYLGGRGLGARIVFDRVPPTQDPLGPGNLLVFAVGPLTGTRAPASGRFSLSTRSPLTGAIHDSNAGGTFGVRLKRCGLDALVVEGRAPHPVYLYVDGSGAEVRDARRLWGLDAPAATDALCGPGGPHRGAAALSIGPAGENLVRLAAIMVEGRRALARGGVGAVMGSKNLKAVVAAGLAPVEVADREAFDFVVYEALKLVRANPVTSRALPQFGTAVLVNLLNELGAYPTRNFLQSQFPQAGLASGEAVASTVLLRRAACHGCPIACARVIRGPEGEEEGPEYESIWALGANCGVSALGDIVAANRLCNRLGLDTISAGGTVACAMELYEAGAFSDGARFGDAEGQRRLLLGAARRDGPGAELAEGSLALAASRGAAELAMQVKGLELPAYDPRGMQGQGLAFATSNRGGCHLRANMLTCEVLGLPKMVDRFARSGKAGLLIVIQHSSAAMDSLVVCKFAGFALSDEHWARMLSAATGVDYATQDLQLVGERVYNLERLYNLRQGWGRERDTLPRRLLETPVQGGPAAGRVVELQPMLDEYYRFRGWDREGRPSPAKLKALGLETDGAATAGGAAGPPGPGGAAPGPAGPGVAPAGPARKGGA
ncbi:MAG: aldehyde ferredoxin oxidoreductase family protein [Acetobacteraceae bacterium]|nr:aldehyde ferredoxin oxidoreductase family protein [Acetobacteraceae bacterium]